MLLFAFHPLWRLIFWTSYMAWTLFEIWVFSRDRRAASGQKQDGGSLFVVILLIMAGIAIAFVAPRLVSWARVRLPASLVFPVAIAFIWLGLALGYGRSRRSDDFSALPSEYWTSIAW